MDADKRKWLDSRTERVLAAVLEVANTLRPGFLEKVYERALLLELRLRGIPAVSQASFSVHYKDQCVGVYYADILVDGALVIELKCVDRLNNEQLAYLCASRLSLCLLVNFQSQR
jgi:GxxExxY protein